MIKRIFTGNYTDCKARNLISISGDKGKSVGFEGKSLTRLAPKRAFWNEWHNNIGRIPEEENTKFYIQEYYKQVLSQVDIEELLKDEKDPILLCYERGQDFCHRHVLAEFINIRYGIDVEDLIIDENLNISINKRPENVRKILEEVLIEQLPYINDEVLKKKVESMIEIER
jgi:uncharacterized protein (DUF488 family)